MVHAFVMVKTTVGSSEGILSSVRELSAVSEAHIVAGAWDLIVEMDTDEVYDVLKTTAGELQSLEGVADTKTYISLEE